QLGTPDMRVPIAYGLSFPERIASGAPVLDLLAVGALEFEVADRKRFPGLFLAWDALQGPDGSAAVLNAANEEAVAAFLDGTIRFPQIHSINAGTIDALAGAAVGPGSLDDLLALDAQARRRARALIQELTA
ncbi:MAG: 1-deoxy-D-xylulose-5-phosphate reductoisomerase, partial [Rubrivivax sp.]